MNAHPDSSHFSAWRQVLDYKGQKSIGRRAGNGILLAMAFMLIMSIMSIDFMGSSRYIPV
jgi:hypothetical protein